MTNLEKTDTHKSLDTLAEQINEEHRACVGTFRKAFEHGIRCGELLTEAKSRCEHGEWYPWLGKNFDGVPRTAQKYMRLYENRDEVRAYATQNSHLTISAALEELSSPKGEVIEFRPEQVEDLHPLERVRAEIANHQPDETRELGVIGQMLETPEGTADYAQIDRDLAERQSRDRLLGRINDMSAHMKYVAPEDLAREMVAWHVAMAAQDAVLGRAPDKYLSGVESAKYVHAWLGEYLRILEEAHEHLAEEASRRR
jgi:hypothetical protein